MLVARIFAVVAVASGCTGSRPATRPADRDGDHTVASLEKQLHASEERAEARDYSTAAHLLDDAIAAPAFRDLSPKLRHSAIAAAGYAHLQTGDVQGARTLYVRASEMEEATADDWFGRANVARRLRDEEADATAITTVGRRWPQALRDADPYSILQTTNEDAGSAQARLELLEALFNARWTVFGMEWSESWRELSLRLVDRGDLDGARLVAERVTSPYQAIAMRVDRRFDALLGGAPPLDVRRVQYAEIAELRNFAVQPPYSLRKVHNLLYALTSAGGYAEVLQIADGVTSRPELFDDADTERMTILDDRSRALRGLDRWDEAISALEDASRMPGGESVNQAINLALLYLSLDRAHDAEAVVARTSQDLSPFGRYLVESVLHGCALARGDAREAAERFAYLREHHDVAPAVYDRALLASGRDEESANELIARLRDPWRRSGALMSVQQFAPGAKGPRDVRLRRRWDAIVARPEVQAAIAEVGRAQRWDIPPQGG
jgi:hypothetical protein